MGDVVGDVELEGVIYVVSTVQCLSFAVNRI